MISRERFRNKAANVFKKNFLRFFSAVFLFFLLTENLCAASKTNVKASNSPDFIAAKVNNKAITNSELLDRYRFVLSVAKISAKTAQDREMLLGQIIDKMIDEELIRQEAGGFKIEAAPEEIREAIDEVALRQKKNATQFKLFFINNGLSFDNYLKQIESEVLWSKIISEVLRSKVKVSEVEVREFFEQRKFSTNVKRFLIAEVVISKSANAVQFANKLAIELRQGADFQSVVEQFSSSITSENKGEVGWISQADVDAKIFNAISKLEKGEYSDPVALSDGYHIFKLLDTKTDSYIADQDLTFAKNAIFNHKLQTVAKGYLMELRKKSFVEKS